MRRTLVFAAALILAAPAHAACTGDIDGFREKRAIHGSAEFKPFEAFRIDSKTGVLSLCHSDRQWDSGLVATGEALRFTYAHRKRTLSNAGNGVYLSPVWIAEHDGVQSEYRIRAER